MSAAGEELKRDYADLLRQGPPFLRLLDFTRRCVDADVTAGELLAWHTGLVEAGGATGVELSMAETMLATAVSFRTLLLQLRDRGEEVAAVEQEHGRLSTLYRTKSSTLSMVAHDLSNYLVSSRMLALSMVRDSREELVRERCRYILKVLEDQEHLVANLLSIGKIEAGVPSVYSQHVDLKAVIARCVESARKMTGRRFSQSGPDLLVQAEEDKVRQVMENLVGNAVKFSPLGAPVEIHISLQDSRAAVSVRDYGIGIAPVDMPHLFEPYYRAVDGQTGGTGLGLSIVKSLLDLMHGDIHIDSDANGTTVHFTLPLSGTVKPI